MPLRHYTTTTTAQIRETWSVDSDEPLSGAEFMDVLHDADPTRLGFVSEEVIEETEGERQFEGCDGEPEAK